MADRLDRHPRVEALLAGPLPWHTVEHLGEVGSTNDVVRERALAGAPPGVVVVADHQTAGRGRAGRGWEDGDDPAASLTLSASAATPHSHATLVPLAAGLAVADALRRAGVSPALKWPNDVLVGARKCAGILVERHATGDQDLVVVGIGIDVDWRGTGRDGERGGWTSIAEETGATVDRGELLSDVLRGLATWLRSIPTEPLRLLVGYRDNCATIGQPVRVDFPDGTALTGRAVDLDREGRLVLDTGDRQLAVNAGDVYHLRPS